MRVSLNKKINQYTKNAFTLVIIMLNSGYALTVGSSSIMMIVNIFYLFIMALLNRRIYPNRGQKNFLMLTLLLMLLTYMINIDLSATLEYCRLIVMILTAFFIVASYPSHALINGFCIFMRLVSGVSCIFYLIFVSIPAIDFPVFTNPSGVTYYTCIIGNIQAEGRNIDFIRNCGAFWEGGMYAAITAIWVVLEIMFHYERKKTLLVLILGVFTIYTTKSTTGYLYMFLLIFLFAGYAANGRKKTWQSVILIMGCVLAAFLYYRYDDLIQYLAGQNELIFGKLLTQNASYTDRFNGPVADMYVGVLNPFGVGTGQVTSAVNAAALKLFNIGLTSRTSTLTYFFAAFGIPLGVIVTWQGIKFFLNTILSKIDAIMSIVLFILVTLSTPLNSNMLFWLLLFVGAGTTNRTRLGL